MIANQTRVRISFHDHRSLEELCFELPGLLKRDGFSVDIETHHLTLLDPRVRKGLVGAIASDNRSGEFAARINFILSDDPEVEAQRSDILQAYRKAILRHKELCVLTGKAEDVTRLDTPTHRIVVAEDVLEARRDLALRHIVEGEDSDYQTVAIAAAHLIHIVNHGHALPPESSGKRLHTLWLGTPGESEPELPACDPPAEDHIPPGLEHVARIELFQAPDLERLSSSISLQPAEHQRMLKEICAQLSTANAAWRFHMPAPALDKLRGLRGAFPNFSEVVDILELRAVLAQLRADATWNFQPLLLLGQPGIGKTEFVRALANVIGTRFHSISMATATAGWILAGADLSWSTGKPGVVFNLLTQEQFANPVILLDEIDKTSSDRRYDPLGALYELLESDSAAKFKDEAIRIPIDASHIHWIATANEINIDPALLSRFYVVHVPSPDDEQCRGICQRIYAAILCREKTRFPFRSAVVVGGLGPNERDCPATDESNAHGGIGARRNAKAARTDF